MATEDNSRWRLIAEAQHGFTVVTDVTSMLSQWLGTATTTFRLVHQATNNRSLLAERKIVPRAASPSQGRQASLHSCSTSMHALSETDFLNKVLTRRDCASWIFVSRRNPGLYLRAILMMLVYSRSSAALVHLMHPLTRL